MDISLLSQPWTIQLALGAGYASYTLAYAGIRQHHNITDVFFKSILFSLIPLLILEYFSDCKPLWIVILSSVVLPVMSAVVWRKWLIEKYNKLLNKLGYLSDESPSAWHSLSHDSAHYFTQLSILTDDNEWLRCDTLNEFRNSPSGPAIFGPDGDVGMYITHTQVIGEDANELSSTTDEDYGDRITFIPKERIKRVNFRRLK